MSIIEKAKELVCSEEVQEFSLNLLSDCYALLEGDITAAARIVYSVTKGGLLLRESLFWNKFRYFLEEMDTDEDYLGNFCRVMAESGTKEENQMRLLDTIEKIDTERKARYLVNASRCVASRMIDRPTYFRICHTLKRCLDEDLCFLQRSILFDREYEYCESVQELANCGLMRECVINANGPNSYCFTSFAKVLDIFSLSFGNVDRYPNPMRSYRELYPEDVNTVVSNVVEF